MSRASGAAARIAPAVATAGNIGSARSTKIIAGRSSAHRAFASSSEAAYTTSIPTLWETASTLERKNRSCIRPRSRLILLLPETRGGKCAQLYRGAAPLDQIGDDLAGDCGEQDAATKVSGRHYHGASAGRKAKHGQRVARAGAQACPGLAKRGNSESGRDRERAARDLLES